MKRISYDSAVQLIYQYTDKLAKEGKLNKKKDIFSIFLPFEHHQAILVEVAPDDNGDRKVSIEVIEKSFIMKKVKNTVLDIFEDHENE